MGRWGRGGVQEELEEGAEMIKMYCPKFQRTNKNKQNYVFLGNLRICKHTILHNTIPHCVNATVMYPSLRSVLAQDREEL